MDKISVLMSTYREPIEWIKLSVESIINQTYKNIEYIIIVDDPDNKELISFLSDYENRFEFVKVVINEKNIGLVASLNKGLKYCSGEYIARMDADDISNKERFEKQLDLMKQYSYDIVGCAYELFYEDTVLRIASGVFTDEFCKKVLCYESCVAHPAWLVKKEVYDSLNGYRDIDACEDLDFLQRAAYKGFKIGNSREVLLRYRDNPKSISHNKVTRQRAITTYISESYRKGNIISEDEYNKFLNSERYKKICESEQYIIHQEEIYKNVNSSKLEKYNAFCKLLMQPRYVKSKIIRRRINNWKKQELNKNK